jgi:hypothetical protein
VVALKLLADQFLRSAHEIAGHSVPEAIGQLGRTFHIGEQDSHGALGQLRCHCGVIHGTLGTRTVPGESV